MRTLVLCLVAFVSTILAAVDCRGDLAVFVRAHELGNGNTLAEDDIGSANASVLASINHPHLGSPLTYSAFASATPGAGSNNFQFKLYNQAQRFGNDGIAGGTETLSSVGWNDVLSATNNNSFFMDFRVTGNLEIQELGNAMTNWELQVLSDNFTDPTSIAFVSADTSDGLEVDYSGISGWQSFTRDKVGNFDATYRAKVYGNQPFHLSVNSIASASGATPTLGDVAIVTSDLSKTVTLSQILDSNGVALGSANFGSGGTFTISSVPEPSTFLMASLGLMCVAIPRRRRKQSEGDT